MLLTCWEDAHRSWITVSEIVRDQTVVLAHGFCGRLSLTQAVRLMCEAIIQAAGRSIAGRSDRPSTSRLLLASGVAGLTLRPFGVGTYVPIPSNLGQSWSSLVVTF